ncbi:MAG TPA: bacteriohopanetetrol glucosamine biosynthesis glycosyltransferase HpnI [Terriglobales bacterium]|nr:bacteriohopanetetrol glucosamine biosynthesis glycosyltransferase HpnI [Terriglobales bacterium]
MLARVMLVVAAGGLLTSTIFLLLALAGAVRFRQRRRALSAAADYLPAVTVLKPVHGMEPCLRQSLESFFLQDYPAFEIIFAARHVDDAALALARELLRKYPSVRVKIVVAGEPPWPNAKVYSLVKMMAEASHDLLVISDSDVEVRRNYLCEVVQPFRDPQVGCVTCLYRGVPVGGLWSRLEALGMSVEFASGVLIADLLEGMKFALGPTMATRREALEKVGGFGAFADYCADDYLLGNRVAAAGYKVVLSGHVIDHIVLNRSLRASVVHQVRWMKSTRYSRPKGHLGSGLTFAMPFGLLGLASGAIMGSWGLGAALLAVAVANRLLQALAIGWGVVRDHNALRFAWLYPLRDLMGFALWVASYAGSKIWWRGERYRLEMGGKMVKI